MNIDDTAQQAASKNAQCCSLFENDFDVDHVIRTYSGLHTYFRALVGFNGITDAQIANCLNSKKFSLQFIQRIIQIVDSL